MILAHIIGKKLLANGRMRSTPSGGSRKREYLFAGRFRPRQRITCRIQQPLALRPDSRQRSHVFFARVMDIDVSADCD
jgi:hypothetical protein